MRKYRGDDHIQRKKYTLALVSWDKDKKFIIEKGLNKITFDRTWTSTRFKMDRVVFNVALHVWVKRLIGLRCCHTG